METQKATFSNEDVKKLLDVEKLKYCFECGICTACCSMAELLKKDYNPRGLLEKILLNLDDVLASDEPWLCARCYRCQKHCPQALNLPEILLFVRKIAKRHGHADAPEKALKKIVENIPLPLVTTLICFHPERAELHREEIVEKAEKLRIRYSEKGKKKKSAKNFGRKIAVIGSGPAGLAVAYELVRKDYKVTIFESLREPGGMLRKCIPEYRLPKRVVAKEIQFLKGLGVKIRIGVTVGKDLSFDDLWKEGYNVVFIGSGAHKSQELQIEGRDLKGIVQALDFLWDAKYKKRMEIGKKVTVIGGGNVAIDAAQTALGLGVDEVTIYYRRSREEMPANPWEVKEAEDEGVEIEFLVSPKRVVGNNGKVSAIECVRTQLGDLDESGRKKPIPIEGSEFTRETSMVILAIGEVPDLEFLPKEVELNEDGTIWVNPMTMETSLPGVFAGGDAVTGPATVIEAICGGRRAAESIDYYLNSL